MKFKKMNLKKWANLVELMGKIKGKVKYFNIVKDKGAIVINADGYNILGNSNLQFELYKENRYIGLLSIYQADFINAKVRWESDNIINVEIVGFIDKTSLNIHLKRAGINDKK